MRKNNVVLFILCFLVVCTILSSQPRIIPIPGSQEYGTSMYEERFVVVNPPKKADRLKNLIVKYNKSNPIDAPSPPADAELIYNYRRFFYKESKAFPRNISFYSPPMPRDELIWEYGARYWIAQIDGNIYRTRYNIRPIKYAFNILGFMVMDYNYLDYEEENRDPTLNGLLDNVPEHMIHPRIRELLEEGFFEGG